MDPDRIHEAVYEREGRGSVPLMSGTVSVSRPECTKNFNSRVSRLMKIVTGVTE